MQDAYGTKLFVGEYEEQGPVKAKIPDKFMGTFNPKVRSLNDIGEPVDEALLRQLMAEGYDIGLTSAGSLVMASYLAEREDKTVVVPIFERFRDYSKNARNVISRGIQLNPFIPEDFWSRVSGVYHLKKKQISE
jgi:hypothetical protein